MYYVVQVALCCDSSFRTLSSVSSAPSTMAMLKSLLICAALLASVSLAAECPDWLKTTTAYAQFAKDNSCPEKPPANCKDMCATGCAKAFMKPSTDELKACEELGGSARTWAGGIKIMKETCAKPECASASSVQIAAAAAFAAVAAALAL